MCDFGGDCGMMGGADAPFNNGFNTIGVGDAVAPSHNSYGSGDRLDNVFGGFFGMPRTPRKQPKQKKQQPRKNNGLQTHNPFDMNPRPLYVPLNKK